MNNDSLFRPNIIFVSLLVVAELYWSVLVAIVFLATFHVITAESVFHYFPIFIEGTRSKHFIDLAFVLSFYIMVLGIAYGVIVSLVNLKQNVSKAILSMILNIFIPFVGIIYLYVWTRRINSIPQQSG